MNLNTRQKLDFNRDHTFSSNYHYCHTSTIASSDDEEDDYDATQEWNRGRTTRRRNSMEHSIIQRGQRLLHTQFLMQDVHLWKSLKHIEYEECGNDDEDCCTNEHDKTLLTTYLNLRKDGDADKDTGKKDTDEEMQQYSNSSNDDHDGDDCDCSYDTISIDGQDQEHAMNKNVLTNTDLLLPHELQIDLHKTTNKSIQKISNKVLQKTRYRKKTFLLGTLLIAFLVSSYFKVDVAWFPFFTTV